MKTFILAIFAVVALASARSVKDMEDPAIAMIECVRKALDGGLESANIPDHNPFVSWRTINIPIDTLLAKANITIDNMIIREIPAFDIVSVNGTASNNGSSVRYTYALYWDELPMEAQWKADISTIISHDERSGNITLNLKDVVFKGVWDMTLPGGDKPENLDDFSVDVKVSTVDVDFNGLSDLTDSVIETELGLTLTGLINLLWPVDTVSEAFQKRINDGWMGNSSRIDAIIDNCQ